MTGNQAYGRMKREARMACNLFVEKPRVETIDAKKVLLARGGRQCSGGPGETEVFLTLRIRHHRRFRTDRTLAQVSGTGVAVDTQVRFDCRSGNTISVFAEVLLPGFWGARIRSPRVQVQCSD